MNTTFSKILFATGMFVIGRWSVMLFVFSALGTGVTADIVQSLGNGDVHPINFISYYAVVN